MTKSGNIYDKLNALAMKGKMSHAVIIEDTNVDEALKKVLFSVKIMLCQSESEKPCGKCGNCVKVDSNSHTDIKILKPEKGAPKIGVVDIRRIKEDAYILSIAGNHKFYIIENADLMTVQAQNAFIKILEEPPKNVNFILICSVAAALLATVRSRCQIYSNSFNDGALYKGISELSVKISDMCLNGDVCGLMSAIEGAPNDRNYVKLLIEGIIEELIKRFSLGVFDNIKGAVEELWELLKISNNNINMNLLKGRIMAVLIELGGQS